MSLRQSRFILLFSKDIKETGAADGEFEAYRGAVGRPGPLARGDSTVLRVDWERQAIKGSRWLLLRNGANLKRQERVKLRELLAANRRLATVCLFKDDLKRLWDYRLSNWTTQFWREWRWRAMHSAIQPLKRFTRRLARKLDGVLAHCEFPLHTSLLEGINNKIKVIKQMAYGFRDDDYFFLKIRAAFPGIRR